MVCFHRSYLLGDKHDLSIEQAKELSDSESVISLPLYLYDHSGLSMSTGTFSCQWDSGQVGFIYVTVDKLLKQFGKKELTQDLIEQAKKILDNEVKTYDQFLSGEVYGYVIEDANGENIDSCWGFFGYDYCKGAGESMLELIRVKS